MKGRDKLFFCIILLCKINTFMWIECFGKCIYIPIKINVSFSIYAVVTEGGVMNTELRWSSTASCSTLKAEFSFSSYSSSSSFNSGSGFNSAQWVNASKNSSSWAESLGTKRTSVPDELPLKTYYGLFNQPRSNFCKINHINSNKPDSRYKDVEKIVDRGISHADFNERLHIMEWWVFISNFSKNCMKPYRIEVKTIAKWNFIQKYDTPIDYFSSFSNLICNYRDFYTVLWHIRCRILFPRPRRKFLCREMCRKALHFLQEMEHRSRQLLSPSRSFCKIRVQSSP